MPASGEELKRSAACAKRWNLSQWAVHADDAFRQLTHVQEAFVEGTAQNYARRNQPGIQGRS
jgi:hypothetical protein